MNFISQLKAKELDLEPGSDRLPAVTSIDGHRLQTYATVTPAICLRDSSNTLLEIVEPMILANIAGYNVVLGMPWLQQHNPAMHCSDLL